MRLPCLFAICCAIFATVPVLGDEIERSVIVSVPDQRMAVLENGNTIAEYKVSTSKFGLGSRGGSYTTPLGELEIASKIGGGAPMGAVFKGRRPTGEILRPNARGRDPIVTRILHLRGLQASNSNAYGRGIYIHGTPQESMIGRPASYGCIRMRSRDVVKLYEMVPTGTKVEVVNVPLRRAKNVVASSRAQDVTG